MNRFKGSVWYGYNHKWCRSNQTTVIMSSNYLPPLTKPFSLAQHLSTSWTIHSAHYEFYHASQFVCSTLLVRWDNVTQHQTKWSLNESANETAEQFTKREREREHACPVRKRLNIWIPYVLSKVFTGSARIGYYYCILPLHNTARLILVSETHRVPDES